MKAPLFEALNLKIQGVTPHERITGMIVVGLELRHLKSALGYHIGYQWVYRDQVRPTWDKVCRAQAGFTEATERYLNHCAVVVKDRLSRASDAEAREILALMEIRPSELSDGNRSRLVAGIMKHALAEGETQESLRREFRKLGTPEETPALQSPPESGPKQTGQEIPAADELPIRRIYEMRRQEIKALAMALGIREKRAESIAQLFFVRKHAKAIGKLWHRRNGGSLGHNGEGRGE